ncbi:PrpF protein-domain-containing protein [Dichotomopilus funicola]|uniref:PrpF protein-domain-containing protein n=1 Tax=Dichotomopilus funicola TaxID=1934379 RepID=A0AAN6V2B7_9PEZI|nr:PrpF protein-domain-containing protein [Dichotomopilus funicola]
MPNQTKRPQPPQPHCRRIPSVWMRSGTSKGLFLRRDDLPADEADWAPIILAAFGSLDGDARQLNGVGGGTSTTSKCAVVSRSSRPGVDVDYTFIQVPLEGGRLDFSGNCGNIASGVGPFAVDEGMVDFLLNDNDLEGKSDGKKGPRRRRVDVRVYNTNTGRLLVESVAVDEQGRFDPSGACQIGGFKGHGSRIDLSFVEPAGSMTGALFPSRGRRAQELLVDFGLRVVSGVVTPVTPVRVSLVDAANPFILVDAVSLPQSVLALPRDSAESLAAVEAVRRAGAVAFGLASSTQEAAAVRGTPKIMLLWPPPPSAGNTGSVTIKARAYSMGKVHPSLQLTGAVCLAAALCVPGTVPAQLSGRCAPGAAEGEGYELPPSPPASSGSSDSSHEEEEDSTLGQQQQQKLVGFGCERRVVIEHSSGLIDACVMTRYEDGGEVGIEYVKVARTARRLFEGNVVVDF